MNKSYMRALRMIASNPGDAPRKAKTFLKSRLLRPMLNRLPTGYSLMPVAVGIHLTLRCNLHCRQCISLRPRITRAEELTLDQWKQVLDQCVPFKPSVYITGGEPLIVDGVEELLRYGKAKGLRIQLQTNGVLLTKLADAIVDMGIDQVTISLDGPEEIHNAIRGGAGTYQKAIAGIKELVERRNAKGKSIPFIEVNCCVMAENIEYFSTMVDTVADLGVDHIQFQHTIFNSAANTARHNAIWSEKFVADNGFDISLPCYHEGDVFESAITSEMAREKLLPAIEASKARGKARRIGVTFAPELPEELNVEYYGNLAYPFPQICGFASEFMRIMPNGVVEPCFPINMGKTPEQPLAEIWNSVAYKQFRILLRKGLWPGCARCCGRQYI